MNASHLPESMCKRITQILACVALVTFANFSLAQQSAVLTDVLYSELSGDTIQINFVTDAKLEEPGSFSTETPPRIALDFFGLKNGLEKSQIDVSSGKVDSIVAVETVDRTRIIINLFSSARYTLLPTDDGYSVTVHNTDFDDSQVRAPKPFASRPDVQSDVAITNVDFRRSEAGGGTLIVDFSDDNISVDTRERDGEIVVDLLGVNLPQEMEQRLDVTDFATPVQTIDSFQNADNVRMVVVPQGRYQHLSLQAGSRYTLVVDPIIETVEDERDRADSELGFEGERLSINFQNIEVRAALAIIADFTGINFVTSDSVSGKITINLKDVPWDQALDVILRTKGLAKRQTGNVIWVAPSGEIQKVEEEELKQNAVVAEFAPLVTEVIRINYAKAEEVADVIKSVKVIRQGNTASGTDFDGPRSSAVNITETDKNSLLSARGSVTVDKRTNSLLVQDVASQIKSLRNVIAKLDKPVRQVLIETRIVEANDTFSRELGARLGFQRITENARFPGANGSNIGDFVGSGTTEGLTTISDSLNDDEDGVIFDNSRGTPGGLAVDLGAESIEGTNPASYAFDIFRAGTGFAHLITLELSALEADGRGRIVASPRLLTANQKEARISQGQEVYIAIPGNGAGVGGGGQGGLEKIEAELTLIVTPQITPDDRVILDVKISQDNLITPTIVGTKQIETQVLADNGETVVIGGIYQEDTANSETKVPLLGDIPILGNLFKKKTKRSNRTELLIFLTPKIISPKLNLG
ncbi:type IV pilus secretin PilQ [Arenicella xantha]|uniref:Type IV pilus assembly protein PilQ n=1 Tax=Arenicella xantha TaxID=644221 RepID=A0A395JG98_9GAMM|nr:type IV pilus secretin PilQ [Arenicella xantha]RBP48843.1 type IV pilus assembly protein PilQ [Arenicella xantha]